MCVYVFASVHESVGIRACSIHACIHTLLLMYVYTSL